MFDDCWLVGMGVRVEPRVSLVCVSGEEDEGAGNSVAGGEHSMGASFEGGNNEPSLGWIELRGLGAQSCNAQ